MDSKLRKAAEEEARSSGDLWGYNPNAAPQP